MYGGRPVAFALLLLGVVGAKIVAATKLQDVTPSQYWTGTVMTPVIIGAVGVVVLWSMGQSQPHVPPFMAATLT
ncbi:hypothetical protein [Geoglobus sp.]